MLKERNEIFHLELLKRGDLFYFSSLSRCPPNHPHDPPVVMLLVLKWIKPLMVVCYLCFSFLDIKDIMPTYLDTIDESKRPQPYMLVLYSKSVLQLTDVFVIIEKQALQQMSLMKAIDVCLKAHYVLDCKYQAQCSSVWGFFDRCVYGQSGTKTESTSLEILRAFLAYKNVP